MHTPNLGRPLDNKLLSTLPRDQFDLLAPHLTTVSLSQGEMLVGAGEEFDHVYFPHSGMLSLLAVSRPPRAGVWLVHRRLRHAGPAGRQGAARPAGLMQFTLCVPSECPSWVAGNTRSEQMTSALPPKADSSRTSCHVRKCQQRTLARD